MSQSLEETEMKEMKALKTLYDKTHENVFSFLDYMKSNGFLEQEECVSDCGSVESFTYHRCYFIEKDMEMYKKVIYDSLNADHYLQVKQKIGAELLRADNKYIKEKLNEIDKEINELRIEWANYKSKK